MRYFLLIIFIFISAYAAEIKVTIKGIDDGIKTSKQQDYNEAVMNAKLQAIEQAGAEISTITEVHNFKVKYDLVESRSAGILQPNFQIMDIGYQTDDTYLVILTGIIKTSEEEGGTDGEKKFRMAKLLLDTDKDKALKLFEEVVDEHNNCPKADEALYYLIVKSWDDMNTLKERLIKLKAYFPESPYISQAEDFLSGEQRKIYQDLITSIQFVHLPAGSYKMGSNKWMENEKPAHKVEIEAFYLAKTEVTQVQWQAVMGSNPSYYKGDERPVEMVSWYDVNDFIDKINKIDPGRGYRLPSEAEWEYACRAGTKYQYSFGNGVIALKRVAWYDRNAESETHPCGLKESNNWNLYDMHGNVWEWCGDCYYENYIDAPKDGKAWISPLSPYRILRGGSYYNDSTNCRATLRYKMEPDKRYRNIGFRLARNN
ncbi:MAG: formylglycine-generating enzyme family protein [FCB group bacterium]|nr:formylglycine-generating enzyme family protein [FCB group bacterium]